MTNQDKFHIDLVSVSLCQADSLINGLDRNGWFTRYIASQMVKYDLNDGILESVLP